MTTGIQGIMTTDFGRRFMWCLGQEGTLDVAFIEPDGTEGAGKGTFFSS